jgi:hypothetical protein
MQTETNSARWAAVLGCCKQDARSVDDWKPVLELAESYFAAHPESWNGSRNLFVLMCRAGRAKTAIERFPFMASDKNFGSRVWNAMAQLALGEPDPARDLLHEFETTIATSPSKSLWSAEVRLHVDELRQRLNEWESKDRTVGP